MNESSNASILLVEDDDRLAPLVVRHLTDSGFAVSWVSDGELAWRRLAEGNVALVVLDIMLPGEDGLSLCRRLHRQFNVAIIMVTARGQESDRILGLELGADDYLPKPFSLWELEARIKAVLRRYGRPPSPAAAWCLSVTDNGRGIPADDLPFVFDRFFRVEKHRGRRTGGAGLGLSIARATVIAQGGEVAIDSAVDLGTTVRLSFPRT
jgi:DNA-binding response OmpR family regulator